MKYSGQLTTDISEVMLTARTNQQYIYQFILFAVGKPKISDFLLRTTPQE
jgi:hypothetical protein